MKWGAGYDCPPLATALSLRNIYISKSKVKTWSEVIPCALYCGEKEHYKNYEKCIEFINII